MIIQAGPGWIKLLCLGFFCFFFVLFCLCLGVFWFFLFCFDKNQLSRAVQTSLVSAPGMSGLSCVLLVVWVLGFVHPSYNCSRF